MNLSSKTPSYLELCITMTVTLKDIVSVMNRLGPLGKYYANYTELRACQLLFSLPIQMYRKSYSTTSGVGGGVGVFIVSCYQVSYTGCRSC